MTIFDNIAVERHSSPPIRQGLAGIGAGLLALLGLLGVRLAQGFTPVVDLVDNWDLYLYCTLEGALIVGLFGYWVGRRQQHIFELARQFCDASTTDYLTGLRNPRYFWSRARSERKRARRHGHRLCLILIDLDRFKRVNDRWGHVKGDEVLQQIGRILSREFRGYDLGARLGGEEFAILLSETPPPEARAIADRVRQQISCRLYFSTRRDDVFRVTASFGIATIDHRSGANMKQLFGATDRALYRAKYKAGNRICVGPMSDESESIKPTEI